MAVAAGLPATALRGIRFRKLFRGVHVWSGLDLTMLIWLRAALLILPLDAIVSHISALWLYGVEIGSPHRLQFSTNAGTVAKSTKIALHRRLGRLHPYERQALPVTGPDRTFVDCASQLTFVQCVQAGDWLLYAKATTLARLTEYASTRHLDGVQRARRALTYVRERVESPMETLVRLMIVFADLAEPLCNRDIFDGAGTFVARGDMVYFAFKVLVEYDGWDHERNSRQRQRDRERREALEALGWRVIVITSEDLKCKQDIPWRVYDALRARGYQGEPPNINATWSKLFH